ncbi:MAG: endolytic transglycosylase MltG [bacterium]|nr:endolytic transglycosylase MltG [bacterium]
MKKVFLFLIIPILVFVTGVYWFSEKSKPVSNETKLRDFLVIKGSSASQVGNKLNKEGFIKSGLVFKLYVQITGNTKKIQAGEYRLSSGYSLFKIISEINKGPIEVWVTIPEGLTREQIAEKYINAINPLDPGTFRNDFLSLTKTKEGYLFPDTYLFPWNVSPSMIVNKMLATFDEKVGDISLEKVVMASLVEEETKTNLERPIVAGILYKRLKAGWLLQVDVAPETYKKLGLPQTPIANPGLMSIEAVLSPEESDYWFYIHDSKGVIHFAKTIEEHNDNIRKYLGK